jgi:hypothetical protein
MVEVEPRRTLLTVRRSKIWMKAEYAIKSLNYNYLNQLCV